MKLLYSPLSPYARKARIIIRELKLEVEEVPTDPRSDTALRGLNPLSKIPALLLDDGSALYDSPVICEYLCALAKDTQIFPPSGNPRWQALTLQALGDGICDAAVQIVMENRREEPQRSPAHIARQREAIEAGIAALNREVASLETLHIASIAAVAALGYVGFRLPDYDWRTQYPALAEWYKAMQSRPAIRDTEPA